MFPPGISLDYQEAIKGYHLWGMYKMAQDKDKHVKPMFMMN